MVLVWYRVDCLFTGILCAAVISSFSYITVILNPPAAGVAKF